MTELSILSARVDRDDRLIEADAGFAAINGRAGGAIGKPLASPQLATIVRLARRLRILVSRAATIADGDTDVECWVRATPNEDGVTVALSPVRERGAWRVAAGTGTTANVPPPAGADWTWETDATLRVTRVAIEAGERHGFDAGAALGQPLTRLFSLDPGEGGALPILEALGDRQDFDDQRATLRASGRRVMLAATARRSASGEFAGFVGGTFIAPERAGVADAGLSHAFSTRLDPILRGPLARIVANADSINAGAEGPIDPHYADYAADIASAARHLMGLVDDLTDIEAIERADFTADREAIDLADVVRRAAGLFAVRAGDAGVTIDRGGDETPLPASGEFRRALQIMVNLIGNAVRYSPRGSSVWIRLQRDGNRAVAIVADRGKGIAPADQARIFDKFERIEPSEPGGSGLGLYIARRLARAMGGDLSVDSMPGEGARFVLTLPAAETPRDEDQ